MNKITGVILSVKSNGYHLIEPMPMKDFNLDFGNKADLKWELGIDPASKYTGIALVDAETRFIILLDCIRDTREPMEQYFKDLYYLLKRLVNNKNIVRTINEKPFIVKGHGAANQVLLALKGKIESFVQDIPELRESEFIQIFVNTWKSRIINPSKGKNRYNAQGAVAEDLCDAFPGLLPYKEQCTRGDLDAFDALGIVLGYRLYAYTENGSKKICGDKEHSHKSLLGYKWIDVSDIGPGLYQKIYGKMAIIFKPEFLVYNEDYSFSENVMMATTNNKAVVTILPEEQLQAFQWKMGIDITEPNHVLLMFAFRKGKYTANEIGYLKTVFEYWEEEGGF